MRPFEYVTPANTKQAASLLSATWGETEILAGGTDLLALMKEDVVTPRRLINIKEIKDLRGVNANAQGLRIGSLTTLAELAADANVRRSHPALADALQEAASPQIRNLATLGGNLCQRPRCWYFRQGYGVLAMKDGRTLVTDGDNRYHAIFPNGPAYFVSASSLGPALVALSAKVKLVSVSGSRLVPVEKFFVAPQNDTAREIALLPNEILTEIVIPPANGVKNATYEVRHKEALDWPLVTASVALTMQGSTVKSARIVLGHVGPTPHAADQAEQALAGKALSDANIQRASEAASAGAQPLSQNGYKVKLAQVAVKRALLAASGRA